MIRKTSPVLLSLVLAIACFPSTLFAETITASDQQVLEQRVKQLAILDTATRRMHVMEIFLLADIYAAQGRVEEAIPLYQEALKLDAWRLDYQLKLAQFLQLKGRSSEAAEKLKFVY